MIFKLKPNKKIPFDQVRAGSTTDARWKDVPEGVKVIDYLKAHPSRRTDYR